MALNSKIMLSQLSLEMEQMKELLLAEQPELDALSQRILDILLEYNLHSCSSCVGRYEKIFALSGRGMTLEERRAALLVHFNSRPPITRAYLEELLASVTGCRCNIQEHYSEYRFTVYIRSEGTVPNMDNAAAYVRLLKPAHLEANLRLQQEVGGSVHIAARSSMGRTIRVLPYLVGDIRAECPVDIALHTKMGRHIHIHPKGE